MKIMNLKNLTSISVFLMFTVLCFSSCKKESSSDLDQSRIYAEYTYEYDADDNRADIGATFREDNNNGSKVELISPSRVDFGGSLLSWSGGSRSYKITNSPEINGGTFNYRNNDDQLFSNDAVAPSSIELPDNLYSISKGATFYLPWTGDAIQQGEVIRVTITGLNGTQTFTSNEDGDTNIQLSYSGLQALSTGVATITIEREKISNLQEGTGAGGKIITVYKGESIAVNIVG